MGDSVFKLSYDNQVLHLRLIHKCFRALFDVPIGRPTRNCNSTESRKNACASIRVSWIG